MEVSRITPLREGGATLLGKPRAFLDGSPIPGTLLW